ncbi:predicted protein [Naegleria gruberi]|uniref:Predicted protein n=1 Tax=Naegleria gruberi TaxID=5762 RepID=D2UXL7_NAEGR|nr:uncharacterized protein NAEGRDRAFT_61170 [Naegleria gruberi]EFC50305.1 predicted protein [Naegleria gruberi]|eukprot:XP_002683049.1 predicted protein [Naegleria gruberi strain NEG-M]
MSKVMFKTLQQHGSQSTFNFFTFNNLWVYILSFCFGFSMFFFAGYHFKLIICNTTTIESLDKERRLYEQHHCEAPYDIGVLRNIKSILGDNPILWLSPFHIDYEGDGCHYPLKSSNNYEVVASVDN